MRKLLVALMVVTLMVSGCAALSAFFCKVDSGQQTQAQADLAAAQAAINALTPLVATVPAAAAAIAALNLAVPVFNALVAGTCKAVKDFQDAQAAVAAANNVAVAANLKPQLNEQRALKGLAPVQ
jgi:hypothetical protein